MLNAGFAMCPGPRIRLVSHNGSSAAFAGVCENVEVDAGGLVTVHPIFVVDTASYALVLGQLFLIRTRFRQTFEYDNVLGLLATSLALVLFQSFFAPW